MIAAPPNLLTIIVPDAAHGQRLDVFLSRIASDADADATWQAVLRDLSRSRLQQLIGTEDVRLAGLPARPSSKLKAGQTITLQVPAAVPSALVPMPMDLDVVYEDSDLLVLNKAAGIVVHPGAGHPTATLVHGLLAHCRDLSGIGGVMRPGIVHRLDAGTSGLLVVAKHDVAHVALARQFAARTVTKRYIAAVFGLPAPREATIDTWYARHPTHRRRFTSKVTAPTSGTMSAGVRRALTTYRVLCEGFGLAVIDILLGTGRTHQIRVHMSDRGHPLVGDTLYGGQQYQRISATHIRDLAQAWENQALHAASLTFVHPTTLAPMSFYAPPPRLLVNLYEALAHP